MGTAGKINVDIDVLREAIQEEYRAVACTPGQGFHFHTGRPLAQRLGYHSEWLQGIPEGSIESFAGTGNPFGLGVLREGERVVDIGSGAGIDSLIAAKMVGASGQVIGVDMTAEMLDKASDSAEQAGVGNAEFRMGYGEDLPVEDGWADVIISNGVLNLMPDKAKALAEMRRVLKSEGRLQIGDIMVQRAVPENSKERIDLWTG
jgi:SAM-dependent methyltransferase